MGEVMTFPKTLDEYLEQYQFQDKEQIYTNGSMLIPVYRVKQWVEHSTADVKPVVRAEWVLDEIEVGGINGEVQTVKIPMCPICETHNEWKAAFCPNCGARMV